jgi:HEAT repeat protein
MVGDPVYEVRVTAWERIRKDFSELYTLAAGKLKEEEVCHILELLRVDSKDDQDFALRNLGGDNLEFCFAAARYLEKCGVLERLCLETDLGDRKGLKRNFKLLAKASEVNVTSFLSCTEKTENIAALSICARILAVNGKRKYITTLARKVFNRGYQDNPEIYEQTLTAISKRGDEAALRLMEQELLKRKKDIRTAELILAAVPARGDQVFLETLISLFKDPGFPANDSLRRALKVMPAPPVLFELFPIIQAERARYPHQVRIEALKLLGEMEMHYCLQIILEHLPIFPSAEAKEFARVLAGFPRKLLINKVENLLAASDAKVRASLISTLPSTEEKEFLKSIRKALKDADPEIRIASVWAIVDFADFRSLNQAFSMLRDPVERVRCEVARAFGSYGSDEVLERLKALLTDENEVVSVKKAALVGLKNASSLKAVKILTARLEVDEELQGDIQAALAAKVMKKEVAALVEDFKDADPGLRARITAVFKTMKEEGEEALVEMLKEDILSLNPFIAEILENTGYVENRIRQMSHRDSTVRREAAEVLSLVGTESAFRGIVLAARDPDDEVRVKVIKALEKLETKEGKEILAALESDGDKRVRKYTHWALERLKAKEL